MLQACLLKFIKQVTVLEDSRRCHLRQEIRAGGKLRIQTHRMQTTSVLVTGDFPFLKCHRYGQVYIFVSSRMLIKKKNKCVADIHIRTYVFKFIKMTLELFEGTHASLPLPANPKTMSKAQAWKPSGLPSFSALDVQWKQ